MYSLKRHLWLAFILMAVVLALIVTLLLRQQQLNRDFAAISSHSGQMIFRFATVRELITSGLITDSREKLEQAIPELEKLHTDISRFEEDPSVPPQLSMALIGKIDMAAVVISLRKVLNAGGRSDSGLQLQDQLRTVADQLLQYDRIIVGQARAAIVTLQKTIIGIMGLGISLASFGLVYLYRRTLVPLMRMTEQLRNPASSEAGVVPAASACRELVDLAEAIGECRQHSRQQDSDASDAAMTRLAETINETTNQLNGIMNYAQLLSDTAEELELPREHKEMLQKIIEGGTRIAGTWGKITS